MLDSADAEELFTDIFVESLLHPDVVDAEVDLTVDGMRERFAEAQDAAELLGDVGELDPADALRVRQHPLPFWVERMTVNYLRAHGGEAIERRRDGGASWDLRWLGGETLLDVVFTPEDAERWPAAQYLTLEDPRVRGLATALPVFVPGQPVPVVAPAGLPTDVVGTWSLWRVSLESADHREQRIAPVFVHDDGRVLGPSARGVWDALMSGECAPERSLAGEQALAAYDASRAAAETEGRPVYDELLHAHGVAIEAERERGALAFESRRRAIGRLGLDAVRRHRARQLDDEQRRWEAALGEREDAIPDMTAVLLLRIEASGS